jgi:hypothetical protein
MNLPFVSSRPGLLAATIAALSMFAATGASSAQSPGPVIVAPAADLPRDDSSPWGMGTSAEWSNEYPKFNPLLDQAGVKWLRLFPEWQSSEPKVGEFNWDSTDKVVADAKTNHIHILGMWAFFAP